MSNYGKKTIYAFVMGSLCNRETGFVTQSGYVTICLAIIGMSKRVVCCKLIVHCMLIRLKNEVG